MSENWLDLESLKKDRNMNKSVQSPFHDTSKFVPTSSSCNQSFVVDKLFPVRTSINNNENKFPLPINRNQTSSSFLQYSIIDNLPALYYNSSTIKNLILNSIESHNRTKSSSILSSIDANDNITTTTLKFEKKAYLKNININLNSYQSESENEIDGILQLPPHLIEIIQLSHVFTIFDQFPPLLLQSYPSMNSFDNRLTIKIPFSITTTTNNNTNTSYNILKETLTFGLDTDE